MLLYARIRYNAMCTTGENPHLIDTKMYLFDVELHVWGVVTELVVQGITNK